jgi:hypothetical protein
MKDKQNEHIFETRVSYIYRKNVSFVFQIENKTIFLHKKQYRNRNDKKQNLTGMLYFLLSSKVIDIEKTVSWI